jgi:hypothetical protein
VQGAKGEKGDKGDKGESAQAAATVRRIECKGDSCRDGCAANEIAIGAFCAANTTLAPDGDRNIHCAGADNTAAPPSVLICAKK